MIDFIAKSIPIADSDRTLRGYFDRGHDDVAFPVAAACRNVAGKREVGQRGQSDVMGPANPGFQHAAAPDRNSGAGAHIMHAFGLRESAHTPEFDIYDPPGRQTDRLRGMMNRS